MKELECEDRVQKKRMRRKLQSWFCDYGERLLWLLNLIICKIDVTQRQVSAESVKHCIMFGWRFYVHYFLLIHYVVCHKLCTEKRLKLKSLQLTDTSQSKIMIKYFLSLNQKWINTKNLRTDHIFYSCHRAFYQCRRIQQLLHHQ